MTLEVHIMNAFVEDDLDRGGNPAGVVLDADGLDTGQKLAVASQAGLSETVFVSSSQCATVKLEFFTPTRQIAHCGHATIAAFSLLRRLGRVGNGRLCKETIDGNRDILVEDGTVFMQQRAPRYTTLATDSELGAKALASLRLDAGALIAGIAPCVVDTGNAFLLVPLADEAALTGLAPDFAAVEALSEELGLIRYYAFSNHTRRRGRDAGARMFAPRFGIQEEAATGMAAGPLACFLHDRMNVANPHLLIEQGWLMPEPSPSLIAVNLAIEHGQIAYLMAGGHSRSMSLLNIEL